jgi:hypothetical protein
MTLFTASKPDGQQLAGILQNVEAEALVEGLCGDIVASRLDMDGEHATPIVTRKRASQEPLAPGLDAGGPDGRRDRR